MTDQPKDLFTADPLKEEVKPAQQQVAAPDQLLASIVNEHGKPKYSSVEDAFKALQASQEHIKRIEAENAEYREKVTKASTTDDILNAIKAGKVAETAPKNPEPVDIEGLVAKTLSNIEKQKAESANTNTVVGKLKELYGDKASETFYQKAAELGISQVDINALAAKSPSAVFKLLGIDAKGKQTQTPAGIRTEGLANTAGQTKAKSAMAHGSTADLVASWNAVKDRVNKKYDITKG